MTSHDNTAEPAVIRSWPLMIERDGAILWAVPNAGEPRYEPNDILTALWRAGARGDEAAPCRAVAEQMSMFERAA